jgi:hypothetical protein
LALGRLCLAQLGAFSPGLKARSLHDKAFTRV